MADIWGKPRVNSEAFGNNYDKIDWGERRKEKRAFKQRIADSSPMDWQEKWRTGDRLIMKNRKTGQERKIEYTDKDKESIKRGDLIQPFEKDKFIEKFGWHPNENQAEINHYLLRRGLPIKK